MACHAFDKAHLVMLAEEGLIPRRDAALMLAGLRELDDDEGKALQAVGGGIHSGEQYLIRKLSEEVGGRIHLGRSSGDLDRTAAKIRQREKLLAVMTSVIGFRSTLLKAAKAHAGTVMPGYTHGQQAQPLTLGFTFLHWAAALVRDFRRLLGAYHGVNRSPAGAAILTGSDFPLNRHRVAELLGFSDPYENAMDAVHSADDMLEAFSAIAILHANLARWADDLIFLSGSDLALVELPDRFCSISSIMPQKKNPVALEHIRGAAAETVGGLVAAFGAESGPTGLAVFPRYHYAQPALDRAFDLVLRDIGWLGAIVSGLKANLEAMEERADSLWATASDLAGALVRHRDLPWRTSHQIVGILVRLCLERGIKPDAVTTALLDEAAVEYMGRPLDLGMETIRKALDPRESVRRRSLYGGTAPRETNRRIAAFKRRLDEDRACCANLREGLAGAAARLEEAIDAILTGQGSAGR
jgi:argininosuccinate lyase